MKLTPFIVAIVAVNFALSPLSASAEKPDIPPGQTKNTAQGSENGKGHQDGHPGQTNSKDHENHKGFGMGHKKASPN